MSWFLLILLLSLTFGSLSEASHDKKLPSAVVVGTVYCDTCFQQDFSMGNHFISGAFQQLALFMEGFNTSISYTYQLNQLTPYRCCLNFVADIVFFPVYLCAGASVAVECEDGNSKPRFRKEVKTDGHGEFKVQLPFSVSKHVKRIERCTVKLISSSEPYCAVASAATSSSLRLKSRKQGQHIFSAGFFSFKPLKQPNLCNRKPSIKNKKGLDSVKTMLPTNIDPSFPPPLQDPTTPGVLPPLPRLPGLPPAQQVPPMTPLPGIPSSPPPVPGNTNEFNLTKTSDKAQFSVPKILYPKKNLFIPNPFLPRPIIPNPMQSPPLIPNPVQPPPLIPNPLQPPSTPPIIPSPMQSPPLMPNPLQPPPLIPNPLQPPSTPPIIPNPLQSPPLMPNPLQPPPTIPNPLQPPSTPSTTPSIPNSFQPPPSGPSPLFPFPLVPGLTPSPPLPPSLLPFPFPPLFPTTPNPGTPPASSSNNTSP